MLTMENRGRQKEKDRIPSKGRSNSKGKSNVECWYCTSKGHTKKECWKRKNAEQRDKDNIGNHEANIVGEIPKDALILSLDNN